MSKSSAPPKISLSHVWKDGLLTMRPHWICCAVCGIIKRHDGKNGPCRGSVKVAMRKKSYLTDCDMK